MKSGANQNWRILSSDKLCDTPYLQLYREHVATPSRPDGVTWMIARRHTAAVVAPRTMNGKFLLIRQERIAVQRVLWEFPAGQVDGEVNEGTIYQTALRELGEEAGVSCSTELIPLGYFFSSVGFTDECCHLFLANDVVPRPEGFDHDEHEAIIEVHAFSGEELTRMISDGEIVDSNTLATYARLKARKLIE
ncbi:MAG TPA: NUDIX hydrolase [Terrimicrobiaceae bacterium]